MRTSASRIESSPMASGSMRPQDYFGHVRRPRTIAVLLPVALAACDVDFRIVGPGPSRSRNRPPSPDDCSFPQLIRSQCRPSSFCRALRGDIESADRAQSGQNRRGFSDWRGNAGPTVFSEAPTRKAVWSTTVAQGVRDPGHDTAFGCARCIRNGRRLCPFADANGAIHSMQDSLSTGA